MANFALPLRLQHTFVHSRAVARTVALRNTVELIEVDAVGFEQTQGGVQVLPKGFRRAGFRLGGKVDAVPMSAEGKPELFLAVGIGAGGIKKAHTAVARLMQQAHGGFFVYALNGQRAEGVLRYGDISAECHDFHGRILLYFRKL